MREIKFRVWTGDKMQPCGVLPNLMSEGFTACIDSYSSIRRLDGFVMQFTGLKDKNGVEIYEGDIVNHNGIGVGCIDYNDKHAAYKIVFKGTARKWLIDMLEREIREIEVIGNIYENPNLITK